MNDTLKSIYYDSKHPAGFSSVKKLAKASGFSYNRVKKWMKAQATYTLHKQARKTYPTRHYKVHDIDEQWQTDLCDMASISRYNSGHNFILTVIDIFSRYAWARPLKTKHGKGVAKAFRSIFREGRIPKRIQSDQGKEFENRNVRHLFQSHDIVMTESLHLFYILRTDILHLKRLNDAVSTIKYGVQEFKFLFV